MSRFSALVVAGTQSGVGKTSVSLALSGALKKRGLKVQTFKCGPDFLDPTWLSAASGRACYNLDGWMMGKEYVNSLFKKTSADADVAVIEGVMGMFDSAGPGTLEGSTAEIALITGAPVALVVDAKGMAASICAMVKGYASHQPGVRLCGVIANNVGSERHAKLLADSLIHDGLPPLVGAIPKGAFPPLGSRHLGLLAVGEDTGAKETLNSLAAAAEKCLNLELILETARMERPLAVTRAQEPSPKRGRIGIALDRAFQFYYRDNLESLRERGCEIVEFSPMNDPRLPEFLSALYLGGGYPEVYAEALSKNSAMLEAVRAFAGSRKPVYAECGGMMYLSRGVETTDGKRHPMVGLLPFWTRMGQKRRSLGYVEAELKGDSLFGPIGTRLRGHTFHYSEIVDAEMQKDGWRPAYRIHGRGGQGEEEKGVMRENVLAGYLHAHLASRPQLAERFAARCSEG